MMSDEGAGASGAVGVADPHSDGPLVSHLMDEARAHHRRRTVTRVVVAATLVVVLAVGVSLDATRSTPSHGPYLARPLTTHQSRVFDRLVRSIFTLGPLQARFEIQQTWAVVYPGIPVTVSWNYVTNHQRPFKDDGKVGAWSEYPASPWVPTRVELNVIEHGQEGCQLRQNSRLSECAGAKFPY